MPRIIATVLFATATLAAQTSGSPERYTAAAIDMNRSAAGNIELVIQRWSTDAERDRLMTVLLEKRRRSSPTRNTTASRWRITTRSPSC